MLAGVAAAGAHGHTQHQGDGALAAGHVLQLGSLVEQRIGADGDKVVIHQLHAGMHAAHGRTDGHTQEALFGNRSIDDTVGTELIQETGGDGEHVAHNGHILAHDEHLVITAHLFQQALTNGLAHSDLLAHLATHLSLSAVYISSVTSEGSG